MAPRGRTRTYRPHGMESMSDAPKPPVTTTTSILPAAMVLGIAVFVLIFFTAINIFANPTVQSTTTIPFVVGGLSVDEGSTLLDGCQLPGNPPTDISAALLVPELTTAKTAIQWRGQGPGGYDCSRQLSVSASQSDLISFYKARVEARGWKLFSNGTAYHSKNPQLLFQKSGSDTFYWILGITVTQHSSQSTSYTVRLYQGASLI